MGKINIARLIPVQRRAEQILTTAGITMGPVMQFAYSCAGHLTDVGLSMPGSMGLRTIALNPAEIPSLTRIGLYLRSDWSIDIRE